MQRWIHSTHVLDEKVTVFALKELSLVAKTYNQTIATASPGAI